MTRYRAAATIAALGAAFGPLPTQAEARFDPPAGCRAYLTVQLRGCLVEHFYTCPADPPGMRRAVVFGGDGPYFGHVVDRQSQVRALTVFDPVERTLNLAPATAETGMDARRSLDALLTEGSDAYDYTLVGPDGVMSVRYFGEDRLTGETVSIDGETLARVESRSRTIDGSGAVLDDSVEHRYVSRKYRAFFPGASRDVTTGEVDDPSPVEFLGPGEDGFLAARPEHDCDLLLSRTLAPEGSPSRVDAERAT